MSVKGKIVSIGLLAIVALALVRCGGPSSPGPAGSADGAALSGEVRVDGSSTVFPISEAVGEEFQLLHRDVRVMVGESGTGGGFKKFSALETDVSDASRPIKSTEVEMCQKAGIEYIELPIAYDGIAIVVNPKNTWCTSLTVAELKKMWEPAAQGKDLKWSDIRPEWPKEKINLYGPGQDSGTFDYFTEAVNGEEKASRGDYTASEDDNVLVQGVARDEYALGYFGLSYFENNADKLSLVAVDDEKEDNGAGAILASMETVMNSTYQPLSRPLFIYVNKASMDKPQIVAFIKFYIENAGAMAKEVGYIPLPDEAYQLVGQRAEKRITGSLFGAAGSQVGIKIEDLLKKEQGS